MKHFILLKPIHNNSLPYKANWECEIHPFLLSHNFVVLSEKKNRGAKRSTGVWDKKKKTPPKDRKMN